MNANPDFLLGVNLPWLTYGCDFGANAWQPDGGIASGERSRRLDEVLGRLASQGLRAVRWFVLCDGRAGIAWEGGGSAQGFDRFFFRDFDAGLGLAARHDLTLIPVLFDFKWCARREVVNGVPIQGRRAQLARSSRRAALLENVVRPLLRRYGREPAIAAWDVFNEPEWATLGVGCFNPLVGLWPGSMRALVRQLLDLVHAESRQPTTVGLAGPEGWPLVEGLPVDIPQLHWYDRRSASLYDIESRLKAGGTVLLGEFPTASSSRAPAEIIASARALGYRGALAWSALADDPHSNLDALEKALKG